MIGKLAYASVCAVGAAALGAMAWNVYMARRHNHHWWD